MARGLNATRLARQIKEIRKLNETFTGFRLLSSIEVDILDDGSLDLSDDILKELDLVVCAVHYGFTHTREKQTERIIRALDNPYVTILAHPSGRLINEREPYQVDLEQVMHAAGERGCALELNAHPARLDLNDVYCRMAKELGVKIAISTDAHSVAGLDYMRFGVGQARRGYLEATDVLNTRPWPELEKLIRRS
jgi:DNA polymerase (family 10)